MKDIITISTVTFNATWGDKAKNLNRIKGYIEAASKKGADIVIFPEMALTGYDDEEEKEKKDKMQSIEAETIPGPSTNEVAELTKKLGIYAVFGMLTGYDDEEEKEKKDKMQSIEAETIPGPSTNEVAELTKKLGIYAVFGMPERDADDPTTIYNSVAVFSPDGLVGSYRKMHLPYPEPHWATRGDKPFVLDTPWGPIGIAICYDSYCFPEMIRYEGAKGCRLHINCTALAKCHGIALGSTTLEGHVIANQMYIASSNLGGKDLYNEFWGGSSIIGPSRNFWEVHYYAGHPFTDPKAIECDMYTATIDLTLAGRDIFKANPLIGGATDYRPDKYIEMCQDILTDPNFGK